MYELVSKNAIEVGRARRRDGFTVIEVLVAGSLLVILCVGLLSVFSYVTKINSGNNVRMQALAALQQEIEVYRSLRFVPGLRTVADLPNHRAAHLYAGTFTRPQITSASGMVFNVTVTVTNLSYAPGQAASEQACTFKEIVITAVPAATQQGWLSDANLRTTITLQRVRTN